MTPRLLRLLLGIVVLYSFTAHAMHPSWDADHDGINDCENDGSCDHTVNYNEPRPFLVEGAVTSPTFDCGTANLSGAEQVICEQPKLSWLDQALAQTYGAALEKTQDEEKRAQLKAEQRGWIKGRDECWKSPPLAACIEQSYTRRIAELTARFALIDPAVILTLTCHDASQKPLLARYYSTQPATLVLQRDDQAKLLYRQEGGGDATYAGQNVGFTQVDKYYQLRWGVAGAAVKCRALD
ncbi:lysozyme inhibitor LprI family protein [Gilvimarinus agarilyticus]|uniref:lysozyme inhibitor LprI family protein n=1 Tax=Gilvimarinus agarilyticus TaxID=679259 RepID=UPI0006965834|nr:lysozyme inhibitor LprI family protein [Gilvimarinus agarilyticus]